LVLLAAAFSKLRHPGDFVDAIATFSFFPAWSLVALAFYVPALELVLGLGLLLRPQNVACRLLSGGLFLLFTLLLLRARWLGLSLTCGCFGRFDRWLHSFPYGLDLHWLGCAAASLGLLWDQNGQILPLFRPVPPAKERPSDS
jgi:hypothetical protein